MEASGREEWDAIPQNRRRHAPLQPEDAADRTFGCRASNPEACGKHGMRSVCAFVRDDGMCLAPPRSWAKQYPKLLEAAAESTPEPPTVSVTETDPAAEPAG